MRHMAMKRLLPTAVLALCASLWSCLSPAETTGFEDLGLGSDSFWNGSDLSGGFVSGSLSFNNDYDTTYFSWSGWSYSSKTNTTTAGWSNQYSAYTGGGAGSATYGVAYNPAEGDARISIPEGFFINSAMITNTTYAALAMRDGDDFAKPFGGLLGNDPDWFRLTILGKNGNSQTIGSEEFYLADYRFADNANDYIVDTWSQVDLSSLRGASTLEFALASSDNGTWGMNTPAYFAVDNIVLSAVPEPSTLVMLLGGISVLLVSRWRRRLRKVD